MISTRLGIALQSWVGKVALLLCTTPALVAFHNKLFLVFIQDSTLYYSNWTLNPRNKTAEWSLPQEASGIAQVGGIPALFILNETLHLICESADESREILGFAYASLEDVWNSCDDVSEGKAASGVSATSYGDSAFLAFQENGPNDTSHMIFIRTHDSCAESTIPFVRTQYLSIAKQMEAGLRFLDLRVRFHADGQLYMYHGGIPINYPIYLKFDNVMNEVFSFFQSSNKMPTETDLISINNDVVSGKEPPHVFYNAIKAHVEANPLYADGSPGWITAKETVTLGEARGKAVLLRRFHADEALQPNERIGFDLSGWLNNNPDFIIETPDGVTVNLQDKWQYSEIIPLAELIQSKFGFVSNLLEKAAAGPPDHWFINFMSAVGDPIEKGEIAESHWIAVGAHSKIIGKFVQGMNPAVRKQFTWGVKTRNGVIAMDYPELAKDSDLISWLVGMNV